MNSKIFLGAIVVSILGSTVLAALSVGKQASFAADDSSSLIANPFQHIRTLAVTGVSNAKVSPDRVVISFAVESQEKTAVEAANSNAAITAQVVTALNQAGATQSEISTSQYNIYPVYNYSSQPVDCVQNDNSGQAQKYCPPQVMKQILVGYKAVNGIIIDSTQLDQAGKWIDAAVQAGVNRVDYFYFTVSDEKQNQIKDALITEAVKNAQSKAKIALEPLGMNIVNVASVEIDSFPILYPQKGFEYAPGGSVSTPIMPGPQVVSATVRVTFEIGGYSASNSQVNETLSTSVNSNFHIPLDSNPSTGYQWRVKNIDDAMVKRVSDQFIQPDSNRVGAGGTQVLTFQALKEGKTSIVLEYVRPWENVPVAFYSIDVTISPSNNPSH